MKIEKMGAGAFKARCLNLLDEVEKRHIQLIITKHGRSMAKLIPIDNKNISLYGCLRNSVIFKKNIVSSTGEKWEADA